MINEQIDTLMREAFPTEDYSLVYSLLKTVTLNHVMAHSQKNLDSTYRSILTLSKGNMNKLGDLVEAAKKDFRDVIKWAGQTETCEA